MALAFTYTQELFIVVWDLPGANFEISPSSIRHFSCLWINVWLEQMVEMDLLETVSFQDSLWE